MPPAQCPALWCYCRVKSSEENSCHLHQIICTCMLESVITGPVDCGWVVSHRRKVWGSLLDHTVLSAICMQFSPHCAQPWERRGLRVLQSCPSQPSQQPESWLQGRVHPWKSHFNKEAAASLPLLTGSSNFLPREACPLAVGIRLGLRPSSQGQSGPGPGPAHAHLLARLSLVGQRL